MYGNKRVEILSDVKKNYIIIKTFFILIMGCQCRDKFLQ
jgi:hypothetical protein